MFPDSVALRLCLVLLTVTAVGSLPFQKREDHDCPPNFCSLAFFKCISQDSCNGTLVPPMGPCDCCPSCLSYSDEGERCGIENADEKLSTPADEVEYLGTESEPESNKGRKCRPGLACMATTCVAVLR